MQFSSGRRTVVYNRVRVVAERRGLAQIVGHIDRALAHERATRALEHEWSSPASRQQHPDRLPALDSRVDNLLTGMRDIARGHASGLPDEHPTVAAVDGFLGEIFPHGVRAITGLPYVDQVLEMEVLVARLQNGMAATAARLGLSERVAQLADLVVEYRRMVDAGRADVDYRAVREARERGQLYLRELIGLIVGTFYDSNVAGHIEARAELLAPLLDQLVLLHERARARRRGRPDAESEGGDVEAGESTEAASGDEAGDQPLADELAEERAADLADGIEPDAAEATVPPWGEAPATSVPAPRADA